MSGDYPLSWLVASAQSKLGVPDVIRRPYEAVCHARGCKVACKPEMLMCLRHWCMVPGPLQAEVWNHYRPGQCDDMQPSEAWFAAADAAIRAVFEKEAAAAAKASRQGSLL